MALTYNRATRDLALRCAVTFSDGTTLNLADSDVIRYNTSAQIGMEGLPLGMTGAASFTMEIDNVGRKYVPQRFDDAEVHVWIGLRIDGEFVYSDFGVWYVDSCSAPEQSV